MRFVFNNSFWKDYVKKLISGLSYCHKFTATKITI